MSYGKLSPTTLTDIGGGYPEDGSISALYSYEGTSICKIIASSSPSSSTMGIYCTRLDTNVGTLLRGTLNLMSYTSQLFAASDVSKRIPLKLVAATT